MGSLSEAPAFCPPAPSDGNGVCGGRRAACWSGGPQAQQRSRSSCPDRSLEGRLMKWFVTSCASLVVGFLVVGPVHAEPQRGGHRSGQRSRLHSGHPRKAPRAWQPQLRRRVPLPWQRHLPWQWLPPRAPGFGDFDPAAGGFVPDSGSFVPSIGGDQPGVVLSGGNGAPLAAAPEGGAQQRPTQGNSRSPQGPGAQPRR
jgi:hypothetical protein